MNPLKIKAFTSSNTDAPVEAFSVRGDGSTKISMSSETDSGLVVLASASQVYLGTVITAQTNAKYDSTFSLIKVAIFKSTLTYNCDLK